MVVEVITMKEENKDTTKNIWRRIIQKKWFFPALYLMLAALLLSGVLWYQNVNKQPDALDEDRPESANELADDQFDEDAEAVMDQQEVIQMPVVDNEKTEIVTKFYDYSAEQEDQEQALVEYNNRYYQSTGIDIASEDDEAFDVVASLSGTVTEVKDDPLLGNVVALTHENDVMTYYASLNDIDVKVDDEVEQGDVLGTAGENLFGKDHGTHVHFELRKDDQEMNPEEFFNQPISKLDEALKEQKEVTEDEANDEEADTEEDEENADEKEDTGEKEEDDEADVDEDDIEAEDE